MDNRKWKWFFFLLFVLVSLLLCFFMVDRFLDNEIKYDEMKFLMLWSLLLFSWCVNTWNYCHLKTSFLWAFSKKKFLSLTYVLNVFNIFVLKKALKKHWSKDQSRDSKKNAPVKKNNQNQFQIHNTVKLRTYNTN